MDDEFFDFADQGPTEDVAVVAPDDPFADAYWARLQDQVTELSLRRATELSRLVRSCRSGA